MTTRPLVTSSQPVWWEAAPLLAQPPLPRRAEVVIVGGGITGVALLDALRRRDIDAVLLERDHLAAGASGRNAGFLLAGAAENYARAVERYGRATAAEVWAFTIENHALIGAAAIGRGASHHVVGSVVAALDAAEAASLEESAALLADDGLPGSIAAAGDVPGALCTLVNPNDGEIDPVRLVRGIASAHADRVHEGRTVVAVEDGANSATVRLGDDLIEAAAVVLATNAWTPQLLADIRITPVRAQMLASAPASRSIPRPVYAEWGHRYWRQRDDGTVLVGGFRNRAVAEEVGYELATTPLLQAHLDTQLRALGVSAPVTHRWSGTMGFSEDGLPLVGRSPGGQRIHVCAGYTGHGMGFAVHAASALARNILDGDGLPGWLDVARFARV
ncbi:MAG: FAD-binding oxidoreductase [Candidatus Dormibacteraeota bacterium]|nr:FAD-binding oxidoreductase [Candidatus Dormibacteraeota bacterium]